MTLTELFAMPIGMSLEEYEKLLKEKEKLGKKIKKANIDIDFVDDALVVLTDEVGSERYNKHLIKRQKAEDKKEKAQKKLKEIENKIKGGN